MRRYKFLTKNSIYKALNKLRAAFLAAKDGNEVNDIIMGILTNDERIKIGRRIIIAQMLRDGMKYRQITDDIKVGLNTVERVHNLLNKYPSCYNLINKREEKVEKEFQYKAYVEERGSKKIFKRKKYTGFKRKDVKR